MKDFKLRHIIFSIFAVVAVVSHAANINVTAKLDSVNLLMGKVTDLQISANIPDNVDAHFPIFKGVNKDGYVSVCGDSVELRSPIKIDTVRNGNINAICWHIPVQSFDSGSYLLPSLSLVTGGDTLRSPEVNLHVYPVNVSADDPIDDYAGLADPQKYSILDPLLDHLPPGLVDFLLDYWWLCCALIVVTAITTYYWIKYKKTGYLIKPKPQPSPFDSAISSLRELKEMKLWENGEEKEYFTRLTDILRIYLYRRFGINAIEMTSGQILKCLKNNPELKEKRHYFKQILEIADFVKFAKIRPLPDDNILAYDNAWKFVQETRPVVEESENQMTGASKDSLKKNKRNLLQLNKKKGGKK